MSTSLLLHFDGPDGSTSFTDSSGGGNLVTANGGARVSASAKFGTGALDCSTGGYLTVPISAGGPLDLSTGDFTAEMWVYPTSPAGLNFVKYNDPFFGGTGFYAYAQGGGDVVLQWAGGGGSAAEDISSTPTPLNTWTHVAIVREGASLCVYVNGIGGTPATVVDGTPWGETLYIGTAIQGSPFSGLIDELRISKGVALYSANFTPPTSPFSVLVTVPDVIGDNLSTAEAALTGARFVVGTVSTVVSSPIGIITAQSLSGDQPIGSTVNLTLSALPAIGSQQDFMNRLNFLLPVGWFSGLVPLKDALVTGIANVFAFIYALFGYVRLQTRIATATDGFLDLIAGDFFGATLLRNAGELDGSYRPRIQTGMFLEKGTRADVIRVVKQLTGNVPLIVEPSRPADCGGYGIAMGYSTAGRLGSRVHPYQAFITVARGTSASDKTLYAAIAAVMPVATIAWVKLT